MTVVPNLWVMINLYKDVFQLSHGIKNIHRSKLYQWYTLRKDFFSAATFKRFSGISGIKCL